MRRFLIVSTLLLCCLDPAAARLRVLSCEALVGFVQGGRSHLIEISFGKAPDGMTGDELDQAIDIVSVCVDEVTAGPADVPGLLPRERKRNQLIALSTLSEDLRFYRNRLRDRERRAAK